MTSPLPFQAQSLEDQLKLLQEQVDHVAHDLEQFNLTSPSAQLKDICSRSATNNILDCFFGQGVKNNFASRRLLNCSISLSLTSILLWVMTLLLTLVFIIIGSHQESFLQCFQGSQALYLKDCFEHLLTWWQLLTCKVSEHAHSH